MAKKKKGVMVIKLLSTEGTGSFYVAKKNPRTKTTKMERRKYDPRIRKHVLFKEARIK
jgi:large subunit ribosomal protein L33